MLRVAALVGLVLASCAEPSRLDPAGGSGAAAGDPWSASAQKPAKPGKRAKADSSGLDINSALTKIAEGLAKPGAYEAPAHSAGYDRAKPHWAVLRLGGPIVERGALSWSGGHGTELRALIDRLHELATDEKVTGLLIRAGALDISLPDAVELAAAIRALRTAGKAVACHAERAHNADYLVLAACERIGLAPLGEIAITGAAAMPVHVKPLLDKLGIQADFVHIGAYKGAAEPLTRDAPSKEAEETLGAILDHRYQTMVESIAGRRNLPPATVQALIDTALFPAEQARAAKLVDDVTEFEAFRDAAVHGAAWTQLSLRARDPADSLGMMLELWRFLGAMPLDKPAGDHVALVYALGSIVDGKGGGVLGAREEIASHTLIPALRALATDDSVRAVVLRIDSGGGSAQASELIWREVAALKAKKPVIVSMSDVAASGGYYIACGANKIFALADTLTGSIGVIGGKLAIRDALGRLGVHTFPIGRGKRATMMAGLGPWTDDERAAIRSAMQDVYSVFVGRVAEGRHLPRAQVESIAQGRVWTGARAKDLGLVDEIGGLDAAIAEARAESSTKTGLADQLEIYPPAPSLRDIVASFGDVSAPLALGANDFLRGLAAVDPAAAAATERLVKLVTSFRAATIQAVAVLPVIR